MISIRVIDWQGEMYASNEMNKRMVFNTNRINYLVIQREFKGD
ncbi:hypothetical protein SHDE107825_14955 [Shewanella denitrificans]|jgi:hypothetical protein